MFARRTADLKNVETFEDQDVGLTDRLRRRLVRS
jgi:hypothetical protein